MAVEILEENKQGHGYVDLKVIIEFNVYFYRAAHEYGSSVITKNVKNFGFGKQTGIDIPGRKKRTCSFS